MARPVSVGTPGAGATMSNVIPIRTCIACRGRDEQSNLLRLARRGDEIVDATAPRLPGRGAYLHPGCARLAVQRRAISRAFGPGALFDPERFPASAPGSGGSGSPRAI